ncbi:MAG: hypothetical protein A2X49_02985 [Lentisphaerae bacterium GWF2_52_8]|nr:MAG: hypothetical protein A2X49_02985 [Lentisphaerae bacterium GWF2_52_8]
MKIIHFSDSHAGGPAEEWQAYLDKRWVGAFNYCFRRRFQHDQSLLAKAVSYILEEKPDLAVCTGDLTSAGQPGEFSVALELLEPLRASSIPLIYVPGNHDYYVHRPSCVAAMKRAVTLLNRDDFSFDSLPVRRTYGGCEFIIVNTSWPSNLLSSCGYLKKESSDFVERVCAEAKSKPRIFVSHYPLIEEHPLLRFRHRLWGQFRVVELLGNGSLDLALCGHVHAPYLRLDPTGRGEICAGSITRNRCLARIDYEPASNSFSSRLITLS